MEEKKKRQDGRQRKIHKVSKGFAVTGRPILLLALTNISTVSFYGVRETRGIRSIG